ncbi:MAG: ABC transporter ATP-binding protein [Nitrososphaerales archaeon]
MLAPLLRVNNVVKTYSINEGSFYSPQRRKVRALQGVSFEIGDGETLVILGRNGSGKSTLCKIIAGITRPDSGGVFLNGENITQNVTRLSRQIGIVLGPTLIYFRMRGHDYLEFFAKIYGVSNYEKRIEQLSEEVGLGSRIRDYVESYSIGMKMKISLARALLHDPSLLILDEFTMGLDPTSATEVREMVQGTGKSVLITTHNAVEAEIMADQIAFISDGKLTTITKTETLLAASEAERMLEFSLSRREGIDYVIGNFNATISENGKVQMHVSSKDVPDLLQHLKTFGLGSLEVRKPTLEDLYAKYTSRPYQANTIDA